MIRAIYTVLAAIGAVTCVASLALLAGICSGEWKDRRLRRARARARRRAAAASAERTELQVARARRAALVLQTDRLEELYRAPSSELADD